MEIRTKSKTFQYEVVVRWESEKRGVLSVDGKPHLEVASPPEFGGPPGLWSPEDLLVAAVNACTMTTFLSAAQRRGLTLLAYESEATGTLKRADGKFRFTRVDLKPRIVITRPEDRDATVAAFCEAEAGCLIANSLLTKVEMEPEITIASHPKVA